MLSNSSSNQIKDSEMYTGIKTYVINIEKRVERKTHIITQFEKEKEFEVNFVKAIENKNGALGLWQTILHIIRNLVPKNADYILICEDDHQFTKKYNKQIVLDAINEAHEKHADILLGGVSWFDTAIQVSPNLFWIDQFTGLQFTIIFSKFFQKILDATFTATDVADLKISSLTENKFVVAPFISVQKEFGYSDVTEKNNKSDRVEKLFTDTNEKLIDLIEVASFYKIIE